MRKSLSEREQNAIKAKLIESCRICWERYGYKKTGVAELASMSDRKSTRLNSSH